MAESVRGINLLERPLFVPAAATAMVGTAVGALSHPWTKCIETEEQRMPELQAVRALTKIEE